MLQRKSKHTGKPRDDWAANLFAALSTPDVQQVPPEFHTAAQWGAGWGVTKDHAVKLLRRGVTAGLVEMRKFRIVAPDGRPYPVPHYRQIGKP